MTTIKIWQTLVTRLFFSKFVAKLVNEAGIFWNLSLQSFFPEGIREMSSALMRRKKAKLKAWDMDVSYVFEEYPEKYSFTSWWLPYYRSTRPEMCCEKSVLRNFTKFTGKNLCQSLFFNIVARLMPATLLKKRLWHKCFPVNFAKFLRTPFLIEHSRWLLLILLTDNISKLQISLLKYQ